MIFFDFFRFGRKGVINYVFVKVEEKFGEMFGMVLGEEMKVVIEVVCVIGVFFYFIDEDIGFIFVKIFCVLVREKFFMVLEFLGVFFFIKVVDIGDFFEEYCWMMLEFRRRYLYFYCVLVEERNEVMVRNFMMIVDLLFVGGV